MRVVNDCTPSRIYARSLQVRELKTAKADKAAIDAALATLLACKAEYKTLTGNDYPAPAKQSSKGDKKKTTATATAAPYVHSSQLQTGCPVCVRVCACACVRVSVPFSSSSLARGLGRMGIAGICCP